MEQFCQDNIKIAVVGAGPCGVYCALQILFGFKELGFENFSLDIFDKSQALRTILVTGATRCNITNAQSDIKEFAKNYPRGEKFLYSIFSRYSNADSLEFFEKIGIKTYIQEDGRVFPLSNSAKDVKDKMLSALLKFKNVRLINKKINSKEDLKTYDKIIVAAGSRETAELIQSFKQPYKPFKKALCALKIKDFNFPKGVSVRSLDGDFIFTDFGISGPLAFKISSLNVEKSFPYDIKIRLFDYRNLQELIKNNSKKTIGNLVSMLIPKSLARVIVDEFDKKAAEISSKKIKEYSTLNLTVISTSSQGEIVNSGGVDLKFLDKNFKSKLCENLWFCGEIVDIDGFCGGYNLQNCWSGGYIVAKDVITSIMKE